mmetsp:Transcript_12238/g.29053  ORF Transcript_12238/g.29053 Transcript_12238/m.29053 type:complete len:112 (-) Transcript_12238:16-351(-)
MPTLIAAAAVAAIDYAITIICTMVGPPTAQYKLAFGKCGLSASNPASVPISVSSIAIGKAKSNNNYNTSGNTSGNTSSDESGTSYKNNAFKYTNNSEEDTGVAIERKSLFL